MRRILAGAGAVAMAAALSAACDTSTRANDPKTALTSGTPRATSSTPADRPAPATTDEPAAAGGTSGTGGTSFRAVTLPAGTVLPVRLTTAVGSDTSRPEQRVDGRLTRAVRADGVEVLSANASVRGMVTNAERSGRVKGRANVSFRFDQLSANGAVYRINTRTVSREAPGTKKKDAATIGVPAAGGAAGTAAVLSTRGQEVRLAPGTRVSVSLAAPLTVRVPR